ncbi:MAG: fumarylacetoacetate hydrolase family protein [Christensenellales bacterium]|jgi:2-keto-4-pentenoate hydratase/2-oxohepta-3-ene-1,7-dioic acid hydratase in catechol pathway
MKLFNFFSCYAAENGPSLGIVTEKGHVDARATAAKTGLFAPASVDEVIASPDGLKAAMKIAAIDSPVLMDAHRINFAPAVLNPEKILCIGVNYAAHAMETGSELPPAPVVFTKYKNALNGHGGVIKLRKSAFKYDYEAELVIIIGREASDVPESEAESYIFGYTCGNDISARDIQKRTSQWVLGKSMDGAGPVGPYVITADSLDAGDLAISSFVNGERRQHSTTADLIFKPAYLISDISKFMTLKPGDMIFTGTPSGVIAGYPPENQTWLKAGDVVEVEIEGIGRLKNLLK